MVGRQATLVAIPDMPARIACVSVSQRPIEGTRRAAARQYQVKHAARRDGGLGFGAQGIGQCRHQRFGIGINPPFRLCHKAANFNY